MRTPSSRTARGRPTRARSETAAPRILPCGSDRRGGWLRSRADTATASFGCCGPLEQRLEHRVLGAPLVVAGRELAEVPLEPVVGHLPVGAADRRLWVAEE